MCCSLPADASTYHAAPTEEIDHSLWGEMDSESEEESSEEEEEEDEEEGGEEATGLQQLTILLMLVLVCCLCVACCTVILRLRCKLNNSRINGDSMERREGAIDRETEERNRRLYEQRR